MTVKQTTSSLIDKNFLSQFFQEDSNPIALKDSFGNLDELQARSRNLGKLLSGNPTEVDQATTDNLNETIDAVAHYLDQIIRGQMFRPKSVKQAKPFQFLKKNVFEPLLQNASPLFKKMISEDLKVSLRHASNGLKIEDLEMYNSALSPLVASLISFRPVKATAANVNFELFTPQAINSYLNANSSMDAANLRRESTKLGRAIRDSGSLEGPSAQPIRNIFNGLSRYIAEQFTIDLRSNYLISPKVIFFVANIIIPILNNFNKNPSLMNSLEKLFDEAFKLSQTDTLSSKDHNLNDYNNFVRSIKDKLFYYVKSRA